MLIRQTCWELITMSCRQDIVIIIIGFKNWQGWLVCLTCPLGHLVISLRAKLSPRSHQHPIKLLHLFFNSIIICDEHVWCGDRYLRLIKMFSWNLSKLVSKLKPRMMWVSGVFILFYFLSDPTQPPILTTERNFGIKWNRFIQFLVVWQNRIWSRKPNRFISLRVLYHFERATSSDKLRGPFMFWWRHNNGIDLSLSGSLRDIKLCLAQVTTDSASSPNRPLSYMTSTMWCQYVLYVNVTRLWQFAAPEQQQSILAVHLQVAHTQTSTSTTNRFNVGSHTSHSHY